MIYVDPRAGSKELYGPLRRLGLAVRYKRMRFGDVSFRGSGPRSAGVASAQRTVRIGIEYKKLDELLSSIIDKRLSSHQLPGLVRRYQYRYLLVLGVPCPMRDSSLARLALSHRTAAGVELFKFDRAHAPITYPQFQRYLYTLENLAAVKVRFASTTADVAAYISALYHWWQKPWNQHHSHLALPSHIDDHPRVVSALFRRPSVLRRIASALPGIGWHKSAGLAKKAAVSWEGTRVSIHFDLSGIPGIGDGIRRKIKKAISNGE